MVDDDGVPTASALFSPRFAAFPSALAREAQEEATHSRGDSVDSQVFAHEDADADVSASVRVRDGHDLAGSQLGGAAKDGSEHGDVEIPVQVQVHVQRQSAASDAPNLRAVPAAFEENSSLFGVGDAADSDYHRYLAVDDDLLRAGEASFGSDDSMASLYDQYYTPTVHSSRPVPDLDAGEEEEEEGREASPTMVLGSFLRDADMLRELEQEASPVGLPYAEADEELDEREDPEDASPYDLDYFQHGETSPGIVADPHKSSPRTVVVSREPLPQVFDPPREESHEPELLVPSPDQPLVAEQERSPEVSQHQSPEAFAALQEQSPETFVALQEQLSEAFVASDEQVPIWDMSEDRPVSSSSVEGP